MVQAPLDAMAAAAGAMIAWACVCRLVKTDAATSAFVRWALSAHGTAGLALIVLPRLGVAGVDVCLVVLALTSALTMLATARAWQRGVPHGYLVQPQEDPHGE